MRIYRTPILIDDEPKIFGGKASLRQALYILAGLIAAYLQYNAMKIVSTETAIAFAGICVFVAVALAFFRVPGLDMPLDQYLYRLILYSLSQQDFPYERRDD